ncbi:MAG TPA: maltotransferase domain-containing protein [Vicinamibacterales bacterium]|nr:maltotransferase domain-containing protein [Vicinamibacterales bacterium]
MDDVRGRSRVIVDRVSPEVDGGRFAVKRTIGETVQVTADIFADGHDLLAGVLKYRRAAGLPPHVDADPPNVRRPGSASASALTVRRPGSASASVPAVRRPGSASASVPTVRGPGSASASALTVRRPGSASASVPADPASPSAWTEVPLTPLGNDAWTASFVVTELGRYEYTVEAWIDAFGSWLHALVVKAEARQDVASELLEGAALIEHAAAASEKTVPVSPVRLQPDPTIDLGVGSGFSRTDADRLLDIAAQLRSDRPQAERVEAARDPALRALMDARPDRRTSTAYRHVLAVDVDPVRARFGAWYEMFPRSCTPDPSRSATFREAEARLPAIAAMGFDVLYLPPVHPIGRTFRKGRNNTLDPQPADPGSPWAIGAPEGGHTAVDPGLGTIADFDRFVDAARHVGLEVALDIAFQASPDHPWVREHPEWFRHRPDGSIKYAENPPKKYQDIYPLNFDTDAWPSLWAALRDVFLFWIAHGVRIFRVDNPHTKSFRFWEWCIADIRREHPDAIFLAEAFTRPKIMRYLAKAGFSQSYTYFTWRNSGQELREYLTELTTTELQEYMRPNFFANTPDILHEYLQRGGRPAFEVRLILAATLAASYGIYSGFELCENVPVRPGSEEYLDSEKYQIKIRDWNAPGNLNELIARVNEIRQEHPSLQQNATLRFHATDNPALLWYSKTAGPLAGLASPEPALRTAAAPAGLASPEPALRTTPDRVFVVANTDPHWMQHGWLEVPIDELGIPPDTAYVAEDLLDGARYTWQGRWNYVRLDPAVRMAHVFIFDF